MQSFKVLRFMLENLLTHVHTIFLTALVKEQTGQPGGRFNLLKAILCLLHLLELACRCSVVFAQWKRLTLEQVAQTSLIDKAILVDAGCLFLVL
jgi:hypothetical protein